MRGWIPTPARGKSVIYLVDAESGALRSLTDETFNSFAPDWSADGNMVYFGSDKSGTLQIWKASVSGGEAAQVTKQAGYEVHESADGKIFVLQQIRFQHRRFVPDVNRRRRIGRRKSL